LERTILGKLQLNLLEYEGRPFQNGILAALYLPRDEVIGEKFYAIKDATRRIEELAGRPSVAIQYGKAIYCVPVNPASLPSILTGHWNELTVAWELREPQVLVTPKTEEGRDVISRIVARAISDQLVKQGWFVENYKLVYHWSFALTEQLSTEFMGVFPGFVFRPYVYSDGSCAIMLDPKFKFVPKITLRDKVDQLVSKGTNREQIASTLERENVIDACPNLDCAFRKDPGSICPSRGAGKRRLLLGLDFARSPSTGKINLIEYHKQKKICPNQGQLAKLIRDVPPIALVEGHGSNRLLEFPLERLREELSLRNLDRFTRHSVTKYMQPPLNERWSLTKSFIYYLDDVRIGRLPVLKLVRQLAEVGTEGKPWAHFGCFEDVPLRFAEDSQSIDAFQGLENYGPYDLAGKHRRKRNDLRIFLVSFSDKLREQQIEEFYGHLTDGFTFRPRFNGMRKIFRLNIPPFTHQMLKRCYSETQLPEGLWPSDIVIVFTPSIGNMKVKQYYPIKRKLTAMGIPCQFVLEDNVNPRSPKYSGYLRNVSLDIYAKVGGTPWILSRPAGQRTLFVGLDIIPRRGTFYISMQLFNSFGLWLGGWTQAVAAGESQSFLAQKIQEAVRAYVSIEGTFPLQIVVHKEGEMWRDIAYKPITGSLEDVSDLFPELTRKNCRIVSVKRGISRVFDLSTRRDFSVDRGVFAQIDRDSAVLSTSGAPHPRTGSQRPITIQLFGSSVDPGILQETCKEVFLLSLVYGGYSLAVTSKPVTTHYASRAASFGANFEITENPKLWRKAWFL
jgi:hypothetical protein